MLTGHPRFAAVTMPASPTKRFEQLVHLLAAKKPSMYQSTTVSPHGSKTKKAPIITGWQQRVSNNLLFDLVLLAGGWQQKSQTMRLNIKN